MADVLPGKRTVHIELEGEAEDLVITVTCTSPEGERTEVFKVQDDPKAAYLIIRGVGAFTDALSVVCGTR